MAVLTISLAHGRGAGTGTEEEARPQARLGAQSADGARGEAGAFVDGTEAAGIDFKHVSGAFGMKWMPETNGSGVAFFDADGDGWTDLLFVQGTVWEGHEDAVPPADRQATMRLYRNRRDGSFEDVTERSGLAVTMYGFGAAPADFDNDGDTDLYVTAYGPNRLFRNDGGGVFQDVTDEAGVGHPGWGSCAAWFDYDGDSDLDLYACNYLRWQASTNLYCSINGVTRDYCNPQAYPGEPSVLYRNESDGTFVDVTREAGVHAPGDKALGVTVADFNGDGWPDLAVANDSEPNFLFENQRDGTFDEVGMISGMAVDGAGLPRSGMGIDVADYRNDGRLSIAIGNFSSQMIGLFEPTDGGLFVDVAPRSQLGRTSFSLLTFGLFFFDYNLDGWLDLLAINGHIFSPMSLLEPNITYEEQALLYRNEGDGRLVDVAEEIGGPLPVPIAGRGAAYADFDRDGDLDVAVTTKEGPAYLWVNRLRDGKSPPHVLRLQLIGSTSNRDAIGAVVTVRTSDWQQVQTVKSGSSYVSQSEYILTFGFGQQNAVEAIDIRWPSGATTVLEGNRVAGLVDHQVVILEGEGIIEKQELRGPGTGHR
ncbi:MAG: CRTAC1 family protein [Acidobacteriota bacterium]